MKGVNTKKPRVVLKRAILESLHSSMAGGLRAHIHVGERKRCRGVDVAHARGGWIVGGRGRLERPPPGRALSRDFVVEVAYFFLQGCVGVGV